MFSHVWSFAGTGRAIGDLDLGLAAFFGGVLLVLLVVGVSLAGTGVTGSGFESFLWFLGEESRFAPYCLLGVLRINVCK